MLWLSRKFLLFALAFSFLVVGLLFIGNPTIGKNSWLSTEYGTQEQTILSPSRALTDASRSATGVRGSSLKQLLETYLVPLLPPTSSYKQYTVKKYHLCMLTITRNEHWLLEFLVRNILAGVTHIVLIDDNRVKHGIDMNISEIVQPFIELGLVTYSTTDHDLFTVMDDTIKFRYMDDFLREWKPQCQWGTVTDSDEMWYPWDERYEKDLLYNLSPKNPNKTTIPDDDKSGIGILGDVIERLHRENPSKDTFRWPWELMYNEHRVQRPKDSQMMAFPRTCFGNDGSGKVWWNFQTVTGPVRDHWMPKGKMMSIISRERTLVIHYAFRSISEYVLKQEQMFKEWRRPLKFAHKQGKVPCNKLHPIPYSPRYLKIVNSILEQSPVVTDDLYLSVQDAIAFKRGSIPFWEEYIYCKWMVASNYEWDDEAYKSLHTDVNFALYVDGFHHFAIDGFNQNRTSCFITPSQKKFCVQR